MEAIAARDAAVREIAFDLALLTGERLPPELRPVLTTLAYCATLPMCKAAVFEAVRELNIESRDKVALAVAVLRARMRFQHLKPTVTEEDWSEWMDAL